MPINRTIHSHNAQSEFMGPVLTLAQRRIEIPVCEKRTRTDRGVNCAHLPHIRIPIVLCSICPFAHGAARTAPCGPAKEQAPCAHLGEPLLAGECHRLGLPPNKKWSPCAKGHGDNGFGVRGFVCPCGECKGCRDYDAVKEE
jgi:hypothetical protein